ncbi:hypothetical protein C1H46_020268 [Malus baccata]|uniref:FRIGIDA-like protein n=1 Tax=Malus baccata TaxID=106549 RepID=A0A540M5Q3_MALBA|nr:hypothetical protein C1H46_020268 [Malus baccata]
MTAMEETASKLKKDLDDHVDSVRVSLHAAFVGLLEREKEIGSRFAVLEAKESEFESAMVVKGRELQGIVREVEEGKSQLQSIKLSFEKYSVEEGKLGELQKLVEGKEMEYYNMQQRMKQLSKEIESKEREKEIRFAVLEAKDSELDSALAAKGREFEELVQEVEEGTSLLQSIKLSFDKYSVEEGRLGELQKLVKGKEMEYYKTQHRMKELSKEIESKERQLNAVRGKVADQWKEFDLRDDEIRAKQILIEEYDKEVKSREHKLGLIEKLIVEKTNVVQSKMKDLCELQKSAGVWDCKLELELKRRVVKVEKQFESKADELNLIDRRVNDCLNESQLKEKNLDSHEKHLDSVDKLIQESVRRLEQKTKELVLKQQEFEKSKEEHIRTNKSKEKTDIHHTQVKIEQSGDIPDNIAVPPFCATNNSRIIRDGRSLQFFMNDYFRRTDSVSIQVSACLQLSSDPAKLVLDAMQGFYPSNSTVENREFDFDLSVIRRSCIHLLKEVKRVSPQISEKVRAEAKKLAGEWRAKMTVAAENWLEVLGFLWLVMAYDLNSISDREELQSLINIAADHEKLSDELYGILDTTDNTPASSNLCSFIKTDKPESPLGKNAATCSSPNLELTATTDARNLQGGPTCSSPNLHQTVTTVAGNFQGLSNEHSSGNHSIQNEFLQIDKLFSVLNGDELVNYLGLISQNKQALEYIWSSGCGDKIPAYLEQFDENPSIFTLCAADAIPTLIEWGQRIEAVRVICTFNLIDKFPPGPLLKEHVEIARKCSQSLISKTKLLGDEIKVVDEEIADLRAVIECIKDYDLESEYSPRAIETKIVKLQKQKDELIHKRLAPCHKVKQPRKKKNKRTAKFQAQQLKSKRQRASISASPPCPIPNPTPGYVSPSYLPYENSGRPWKRQRAEISAAAPHPVPPLSYLPLSYLPYENIRHPRQFGMAANDVGISTGTRYHCDELQHLERVVPSIHPRRRTWM